MSKTPPSRAPRTRARALALGLGDYAAGAVTGAAAAVPIHAVVETGSGMILAMLIGMGIGTLAHLVVLVLTGPLLGFFQVMAPGGFIGMYGGMLFAMRDSMQAVSWSRAVGVAIVFGLLVVAALNLYDRVLRSGSASTAEATCAQ